MATKHYGVWFMKVREGLPNAAIAAQTGWSEKTIDKMIVDLRPCDGRASAR